MEIELVDTPKETTIHTKIFNINKTDYGNNTLFTGQDMGLIDTINTVHEDLTGLYKKLKSQDWDELEFDYEDCAVDFEQASPKDYQAMKRNLGWQWETDTVAARALPVIFSAFVTSSDLYPLTTRICDNEILHSLTYSEIVKQCFKNANEVIDEIIEVREALHRLNTAGKIFSDTYLAAIRILNGESTREQEHKHIVLFYCALYALERVQFTSSFAITFGLCKDGRWNPIGRAIQKIAQDELEVHAVHARKVISKLMNVPSSMDIIIQEREIIEKIINEVLESEFIWVDYNTDEEGYVIAGIRAQEFKDYSIKAALPYYELFYLDCPYPVPEYDPLPYMKKWVDVNAFQGAAQEERSGAYLLGMVKKDLNGTDDFKYKFEYEN